MYFPEKFLDLLKPETKAYLYLATIMPDGSPQVTPVWFDTDGEHILVNTNEGRIKDRNMKARPKVAMVIQDPRDPFRYLQIRGKVASYTREALMSISTCSAAAIRTSLGIIDPDKNASSLKSNRSTSTSTKPQD